MPEPRASAGASPLAVVTGASSGIGEAVARLLARRGMRTVLIARSAEPLRRLADELSPFAPSAAFPLDLADVDAIETAAAEIVSAHGDALVLINNAGYNDFKPFLSLSPAEHERLLDVNYVAPARLVRALLPGMLEQARAGATPHVINVSSMSSKVGPWGHAAYAAAKSALTTLTHALDTEYASAGVRFSVAYPGLVRTPFFDRGEYPRLLDKFRRDSISPQQAARAIVGLLDHPRLDLCIPGHYRLLDVLRAFAPTWTHRTVSGKSRLDAPPHDAARTAHATPANDDRVVFTRLPARGPQTSRADRDR